MMKKNTFENFPVWMVVLSNLVTLLVYAVGAYIIAAFGTLFVILYLLYILWIEYRLMSRSCVNCYYYNRLCCFGRGKLCSLILKKGNRMKFLRKKITWVDIIPDFLASLIPLGAGAVLLVMEFNMSLLIDMVFLAILAFPVTGFIRGGLACKYCKQKEIGCPAQELFSKKTT